MFLINFVYLLHIHCIFIYNFLVHFMFHLDIFACFRHNFFVQLIYFCDFLCIYLFYSAQYFCFPTQDHFFNIWFGHNFHISHFVHSTHVTFYRYTPSSPHHRCLQTPRHTVVVFLHALLLLVNRNRLWTKHSTELGRNEILHPGANRKSIYFGLMDSES